MILSNFDTAKKAAILPKVSVIIPNYNHAKFLHQRINSVLNQGFKDFEVILLDDCSTDNSLDILKEYAANDPRISLYPNAKNSGSTFAQWNKGVALAQGEYVWIAESDDFCDTTLLEKLVDRLEQNPNVGIAFAQSMLVDEAGKDLHSFNDNYEFIFNSQRWHHDFVADGRQECAQFLMYSNTIPNASGALMRKSIYLACGGAEPGWRLNGDWFFYVKMLLRSDLAFVAEHLNFFRVHTQTQRHKARQNHVVFDEIIYTLQFIEQHTTVPAEVSQKAWANVASWWGGSLFFQEKNKTFYKENWRLYKFFKQKRPRLALNIISNSIFIAIGKFLDFIGIKPVIKSWRAKLLPKKYFKH